MDDANDGAATAILKEEIESISAKRSSLRDKLKRRREAIGSILKEQEQEQERSKVTAKEPKVLRDASSAAKGIKEASSEPEPASTTAAVPPGPTPVPTLKSGSSDDDLMSLLAAPSAKEKADKEKRDEILELLGAPTAKERSLIDSFKSSTGVQQFCAHSTKAECLRATGARVPCHRLHFAKIIQPHTDESLGDCSFLNTCFHMDTCKYIHYQVDPEDVKVKTGNSGDGNSNGGCSSTNGGDANYGTSLSSTGSKVAALQRSTKLVPPQWVQCDLRNFDLCVLGKFNVVMADPPWDIHMELPYGTMSDEEMRRLPVPTLQDDGLIFLWVTGRAMELGRECLKLWGYERVDEIIWVKTNQLQRIIRTGRTGHWLNHGKEHCLVGMKGKTELNRGLDCDVIVAEVRATSHKPDEIYGIIERLSPGTRKIELFGRPHNVQPNWVTLGNQLDGIVIHDPPMMERWSKKYPNGYNITENIYLHPRQTP